MNGNAKPPRHPAIDDLLLQDTLLAGVVGLVAVAPQPATAAPSVVRVTGSQGNWQLTVDGAYVRRALEGIVEDHDLSRYVL